MTLYADSTGAYTCKPVRLPGSELTHDQLLATFKERYAMTAMTAQVGRDVVHLTTFSREELDTVLDALNIAGAQYHAMVEQLRGTTPDMRETLLRQSAEASALRLRIEASL